MSNIIEIKNVNYKYETDDTRFSVLKNLSLNIEKGSFVAILGHNGSGKSTLAKLMNGLYKPTDGDVIVDGINTKDEKREIDVKKTVGMIFQNPDNQIVATIVEEDVAFGLENIGIPTDEMRKRVENSLSAVGMLEHKDDSPYDLSGGQKQRVAIAGVIAMEPKCIVLDEPTAMLDPKGRRDVINILINLCREKGITVILITHYMNEAANADRIIVLNNGIITADGTPKQVFSQYDVLKDAGLQVPQATELMSKLKQKGLNIKNDVLTTEECAAELARYFSEE